jgi:glycerol-3-phosphate acyltransferase PlsX
VSGKAGKVRIALDAMGGDYAPEEIVQGAVMAANADSDLEPILVGPLAIVEEELTKYDIAGLGIRCVDAVASNEEVDPPVLTVLRQPNSSVAVAVKLVASGEADGMVGATATGLLVASAVQYLGMMDGIERPVFGAVLSRVAPTTVVLDLGANVDCKPAHLVSFAVVGTVYARALLQVSKPRVALVNIGRESTKGNRATKDTYSLLEKSGLNFVGNIEGHEILSSRAEVIVCDGFVGNLLFKFTEAVREVMDDHVGRILDSDCELQPVLVQNLTALRTVFVPPVDVVGGGILWGVNGLVTKAHGRSQAATIARRLGQTKFASERDIVGCLQSELERVRRNVSP